MPDREHTDPKALDEMWQRPSPQAAPAPRVSFLRRLWTWTKEDLFGEPYEPPVGDDVVMRRIRVHQRSTALGRKLQKLPAKDAAEILVVTAMLLGFEDVWSTPRRAREVRRP